MFVAVLQSRHNVFGLRSSKPQCLASSNVLKHGETFCYSFCLRRPSAVGSTSLSSLVSLVLALRSLCVCSCCCCTLLQYLSEAPHASYCFVWCIWVSGYRHQHGDPQTDSTPWQLLCQRSLDHSFQTPTQCVLCQFLRVPSIRGTRVRQ